MSEPAGGETCGFEQDLLGGQALNDHTEPPLPMFAGVVHPYADAFPDGDADALAADIATNGLIHPIVLDSEGRLIDGRTRLAACAAAGVEPVFVVYDGDPVAFIVSANMQRRDLTQGQKAHLAVKAAIVQGLNIRETARVAGVAVGAIAEARVVAEYAPHLSEQVIRGLPHAKAYEEAKGIKRRAELDAQMIETLRTEAPDLLDKELTLPEAWAAYQERTREQREEAEALERNARDNTFRYVGAVAYLGTLSGHPDAAQEFLSAQYRPDIAPPSQKLTPDRIDAAIAGLQALRAALGKERTA